MSKRPGLFSLIWKELTEKSVKYQEKKVGQDVYGNIFFESNQRNFRGQPTRFHMQTGGRDILNKISPEWDAWLRYRRKDPPSEEEVLRNVKISEMKKINAAEKNQQLMQQYAEIANQRKETEVKKQFNEFNNNYPKHEGVETNPGESKKS